MEKGRSIIKVWLYIGLIMVFVQVLIGGITRLTDSGLSITEWELVKGVIPPLNEAEWTVAFEKYQNHAKRQYEVLHADMTLSSFKWIYFWEWFHRIWARTMGFVFLIPLIFFAVRKWVDKKLGWQLAIMFSLAALEGVFGWIMVASGLNNDDRTWVSAYKLIIHLGIATALFGYIYWTILSLNQHREVKLKLTYVSKLVSWILLIFFVQIIFGGLMAGMRAAILYPYYPVLLHMEQFSQGLSGSMNLTEVINYEPSVVLKTWIQLIHRSLALVLLILAGFLYRKMKTASEEMKYIGFALLGVLAQYILGVITIIFSQGTVPVLWGVLHQGMALLVLLLFLQVLYKLKYGSK